MALKIKISWIKCGILILIMLLISASCFFYTGRLIGSNPPALKGENQIFEAEDASLNKTAVLQDPSARGGRFVHMIDTGSVTFHVPVNVSGRYRCHIVYRSPGKDNVQYFYVNGISYAPEIGFPASGVWGEICKTAGLKRGLNRIEISASWGNMDVDYLSVEGPVSDRPEITPVQNTYYPGRSQTDLFVQLEKNHHKFTSITCKNLEVPFRTEPVSFLEDALLVRIPISCLETLDKGHSQFCFNFSDTETVHFDLQVAESPIPPEFYIVSLDVSHGTAVLIRFPTGKILLVDTGTETMCRERVLPFLSRHDIIPYYLWITHYHDDHCGGKKLLEDAFPDLIIQDYKDFRSGETFEFERTQITVINSFEDGNEREGENSRSLSFRLACKDFVYIHGGDIYAENQRRILNKYGPDMIRCHVYHANHHFHGSVDVDYLRASDPYLFIVSGEEHIYGRGAYTTLVQEQVLSWLRQHDGRLIEDLLHFEVGHVVIRVVDGEHWLYETYRNTEAVIPFQSFVSY